MPAPSPMLAFVTGGASGLGAAICRQLAAAGMRVTLCDLNARGGAAVAREIDGSFVELDVTDAGAVAAFFQSRGYFPVLVNNVGVDQHAFFTDTSPMDWQRILQANLESVLNCTHGALPQMQAAGYGRIVNIGSEAGRLGSRGGSVYAAAKAGVIGFTKSIARENARCGITANVILPGPIRTPMLEDGVQRHGEKLRTRLEQMTLMGRLGEPAEVAGAVAYFASAAASYVTGEVLGVSGGMGCGGP